MKKFNKIMGSFNKVIVNLESLSKAKKAEKKVVETEISKLESKIIGINTEEKAASEVASKLKAIFTPGVKA